MNSCDFVNVRIAGPAKYTPAYTTADGKNISAKAEFNVIENVRGKNEHKNTIRLTAWGGLADTLARSGAPGKKLSVFTTYRTYKAHVWYPQPDGSRSKIAMPDGSFMTTTKGGFTVDKIDFDTDSKKQIAAEIDMYNNSNGTDICGRPQGWDVEGSQQAQIWDNIMAARNNAVFQPGMKKFVFAEVQAIPQGASYTPPKSAGTAQVAVQQPVAQAPVQQGFTPPVGNPNVAVQAGQVQVHGQNMGQVFTQPVAPTQQGFTPPVAPAQGFAPQAPVQGGAVY